MIFKNTNKRNNMKKLNYYTKNMHMLLKYKKNIIPRTFLLLTTIDRCMVSLHGNS